MNWIIAIVVVVGLVAYRVSVEPERKAQEAQMIEQISRNSAEQAYTEQWLHRFRQKKCLR